MVPHSPPPPITPECLNNRDSSPPPPKVLSGVVFHLECHSAVTAHLLQHKHTNACHKRILPDVSVVRLQDLVKLGNSLGSPRDPVLIQGCWHCRHQHLIVISHNVGAKKHTLVAARVACCNTALASMTACTGVGKWLHTLPSHPTLGKLQGLAEECHQTQYVQVWGIGCTHYLLTQHWVNFGV